MSSPQTVICTYRIQEGKEEAFLGLLEKHWPTMKKLGLSTDDPPLVYRGTDASGKTFFVEIWAWKNARAIETAHQTPDVMAVWEPMGGLCEERLGLPKMEFPHVESVQLSGAGV